MDKLTKVIYKLREYFPGLGIISADDGRIVIRTDAEHRAAAAEAARIVRVELGRRARRMFHPDYRVYLESPPKTS